MAERKGRIEDARLVTGKGRYTDDLAEPEALHVAFVRSPVAAARVRHLETRRAAAMPGVVALFTEEDLAAEGVGPVQASMKLSGPDGHVWEALPRPLLASTHVRYVGEPLAMVVAESRAAAWDAVEAIDVDLDEQAAVVLLADAVAPDAPLVWDERPGNLALEWGHGDWTAAGMAIEHSAHRIQTRTKVSRINAAAMEPRTALARSEGGQWALYLSHQNPHAMRTTLASTFKLSEQDIRVVAGDVGGAFGMKSGPLREEMLCFWAARKLDRPVRWRAERTDDFLSDEAGRDVVIEAELGLDEEGLFTALRVLMRLNVGAYASARSTVAILNFGGIAGVYRTPVIAGRAEGYLTNTVPVAAYRGAGRPEATLAIERLVDAVARELAVDPLDLRRRNLIAPEAMPWKSPFLFDYDCGEFERVLDAGAERADIAGFPARRSDAERRGVLRGLGLCMCIEVAGGPYGTPGRDYGDVEIHADGTITVFGGAFSAGQGLETAMIDVTANALGLAAEDFRYVQGDTVALGDGKGMGGSSAMTTGGSALLVAVERLIATAKALAADELEVSEADLEYEAGVIRVTGTDRSVTLAELADRQAKVGQQLRGSGDFQPSHATFPNGLHACEVEIDPETGQCRIVSYSAVEDIGHVLNPQLAEGQIHGGVAQGLGQVVFEEMVYAPGSGQLLSASYQDYALPRATDLPSYDCGFAEVATDLNPLKVKGVGEAGSVGALAAGLNAILDALASAGVTEFDMPATPARLWEALRSTRP